MSLTMSDDKLECARNGTNNDPNDEVSDKGASDILSDGKTNSGSSATTSSGKENHEEVVFEDYIRSHLKNYKWYHGMMFGNIVDKLLKWDNSFLVRRVWAKSEKFLCISVRIQQHKVFHFRLNQDEYGWSCPKVGDISQPIVLQLRHFATTTFCNQEVSQPCHFATPNFRNHPISLLRHFANGRFATLLHEKYPQFRMRRFEHIYEIINAWSQVIPSIIAVPRCSMVLQHDSIVLERVLGQGAFGQVFKAKFTSPGATASIEVAAKKALGDAKRSQIQEFCHESSIMAVLQHENVVAFYGIASLEEPIMVLMELVMGGDLEKYLKSPTKITKLQIIYFALNIANGMRHIAAQKVIHRDLAARNCLITEDLKVKISDFGLSRMGPEVIEKSIKKAPIRWMAPESLTTGLFNEKTDVWSYGVVLTEMMTRCAHKPLWPMNIKDAQEWIKTNERPHRVENGEPKELLAIVDACCDKNPETRFNFQTVKRHLRSIYSTCLAAPTQGPTTNPPLGPTSGVIPLEAKKSTDRQRTMNTTLTRKKSKDGIRSSKSKKSAKRRFLSFRRKNKNTEVQGGLQLPTGMSTVLPSSPKSTAPPPPLPPPQSTTVSPNVPMPSVTIVPRSPSQNTPPQTSAPQTTTTQSKSPTTPQ